MMLSAIAARRAQAPIAPGSGDEQNGSGRFSKVTHSASRPSIAYNERQKRKREQPEPTEPHPYTPKAALPRKVLLEIGSQQQRQSLENLTSIRGAPKRRRAYSPSQPLLQSDGDYESGNESDADLVISSEDRTNHLMDCLDNPLSPKYFSPEPGRNVFRNTLSGTVIILGVDEALSFVGVVEITVLQGVVEVFGTRIIPSLRSTPVFAPRSHPIPLIQSREPSLSTPTDAIQELSPPLKDRCKPDDTVILLRGHNSGIRGLGDICKIFDTIFQPPVDEAPDDEGNFGIEGFHAILRPHPNISPFVMPDSWKSVLDASVSSLHANDVLQQLPLIAIIKGPKRSGKSTFARTLTNRLLSTYQRVAFLESDIGQSEFTPSGMVSLHLISQVLLGPSFCHPAQPYRAHFIGSNSPKANPSHYVAAIADLLRTFRLDLQSGLYRSEDQDVMEHRINTIIPLVVNTQGWEKGMGADLLRCIEEMVQPTHIFSFESDDSQGSFGLGTQNQMLAFEYEVPGEGSWLTNQMKSQLPLPNNATSSPLHLNPRPISLSPLLNPYSASDLRCLSLFSYLYARLKGHGNDAPGPIWPQWPPLVALPPYEVDWETAIDAVILVGSGADEVTQEDVHCSLACSLVGIIGIDDGYSILDVIEGQDESSVSKIPYVPRTSPPDPSASSCLGLGVIRAISSSSPTFQLLTPIDPSHLSRCRILVKGNSELPIWGFIETLRGSTFGPQKKKEHVQNVCGVPWDEVPYIQYRRVQTAGGSVKKARRNLMRRDQS